jgi:hypothetical protein
MDSKESAITSKSNKKAELKQRIFSTFNSSHIPSIDTNVKKELNEPKTTKKYYDSTFITSRKEKLLQLINEKCFDKFKFQQISNEPIVLNYQVANSNEMTKMQTDTSNLIKPVALRPKKNNNNHNFQINKAFNYKRTSVDLSSIQDSNHFDGLFNLTEKSSNPKDESLVFVNRTNRYSRFVDRRGLNTMSMHSFNDDNLIKNTENSKGKFSKTYP